MIWTICYILSLAAALLCAVIFVMQYKRKRKKFSSAVKALIIGCSAAVFLLHLPIQIDAVGADAAGIVKAVLLSLNRSLRAFVLTDINYMNPGLNIDAGLYGAYSLTMMLFCFICPCLTISFILSFFSKVRSGVKCLLFRRKDLYVFSQMNPHSLALAKDLYTNHKDRRAVFCGVNSDFKSSHGSLIGEAEQIDAICFDKDMWSVRFRFHSKKKTLCFFMIGTDEQQNTNEALELVERYRERDNTAVYLFSSLPESYMILSGIDRGKVKIRRIDTVRSSVYRFLYDEGERLFAGAADTGGDKLIHAVIVGLDRYGKELLKALTWYCQMDGYRLVIDAFDGDPASESRLKAECPDLFDPAYNGKVIDGEALYTLNVYAGVDILSDEFDRQIHNLSLPTFAFVSLGDDSADIETSVRLRTLFERSGVHPALFTVIRSDDKKRMIDNIENFKGQKYDVRSIGDVRSTFSEKEIFRSELEQAALDLHKQWGGEESFWRYEYNYQSSLARAIHLKIRRALYPQRSASDMSVTEHKRWNAYMRSLGYTYSGSPDPSSRNDLAKVHPDLVPYDQLRDAEKEKDDFD